MGLSGVPIIEGELQVAVLKCAVEISVNIFQIEGTLNLVLQICHESHKDIILMLLLLLFIIIRGRRRLVVLSFRGMIVLVLEHLIAINFDDLETPL